WNSSCTSAMSFRRSDSSISNCMSRPRLVDLTSQYTRLLWAPNMNPTRRPDDSAPAGMGGSTRMLDPSEAIQDRARRRWMNLGFVVLASWSVAQLWRGNIRSWDWLTVVLLLCAAVPAGVAIKVFEWRFKMSRDERRQLLRELPARCRAGFFVYGGL